MTLAHSRDHRLDLVVSGLAAPGEDIWDAIAPRGEALCFNGGAGSAGFSTGGGGGIDNVSTADGNGVDGAAGTLGGGGGGAGTRGGMEATARRFKTP